MAALEKIVLDYETGPFALDYDGAQPKSLTLCKFVTTGETAPYELAGVARLCAKANSLKIIFHHRRAQLPPALGASMTNLHSLSIEAPQGTVEGDEIAAWVEKMPLLRELSLTWMPRIENVFAALPTPSALKSLTLPGQPPYPLETFGQGIKRFSSLESLMICSLFKETSSLIDAVQAAPFVENDVETRLAKLADLVPDHMRGLDDVALYMCLSPGRLFSVGESYMPIGLLAGLFVQATTPEAAEHILPKLKKVGINKKPHADADTALSGLLASPTAMFYPGKLKALVAAGADLFQAVTMAGPSTAVDLIPGNSLHLATRCAQVEIVTELLALLPWEEIEKNDFEKLRTAQGYTPLHFICPTSGVWTKILEAIYPRYPGVLLDSKNVTEACPLLSLHQQGLAAEADNVLLLPTQIMALCPDLFGSGPLPRGLLAHMFEFYTRFFLLNVQQRAPSPFVLADLEETRTLASSFFQWLLQFEPQRNDKAATRSDIGFPDERDLKFRAMPIAGAFLFCPELVPLLTRGESNDCIGFALLLVSVLRLALPTPFQKVVTTLLRSTQSPQSALINFHSRGLFVGVSPLAVILLHTFPAETPDSISTFWEDFFFLVDQGAGIESDGAPVPIFGGFCAGADLLLADTTSRTHLTKLLKFLLLSSTRSKCIIEDIRAIIYFVEESQSGYNTAPHIATWHQFLFEHPEVSGQVAEARQRLKKAVAHSVRE